MICSSSFNRDVYVCVSRALPMASTAVEEAASLNGNAMLHPSFAAPYSVPVFLRAAVLRVTAGNLMLSAVFVGCIALIVDDLKSKLSCSLACATSVVATYHYLKLISIREQTGTRIKLSKPGDDPTGPDFALKLAWQELSVDAVRYSDWAVCVCTPAHAPTAPSSARVCF